MYPDCQPGKQEIVQDWMESLQETLRGSVNKAKVKSCAISGWFEPHDTFLFAAEVFLSSGPGCHSYGSSFYLLSGSHLLSIEWLKHLGPRENWLRGVSPVSRQQITKGMGRVKVEELNGFTYVTLRINGHNPVLKRQGKQIWIQMHGKIHPQGDSPLDRLERNKSHLCRIVLPSNWKFKIPFLINHQRRVELIKHILFHSRLDACDLS